MTKNLRLFRLKLALFFSFTLLTLSSCVNTKPDTPIIIPPNFAEMPDINEKDEPKQRAKEEDIEKLKELLID